MYSGCNMFSIYVYLLNCRNKVVGVWRMEVVEVLNKKTIEEFLFTSNNRRNTYFLMKLVRLTEYNKTHNQISDSKKSYSSLHISWSLSSRGCL